MGNTAYKDVVYLRRKKRPFKLIYISIILIIIAVVIWILYGMYQYKVYIVANGSISETFFSDAIIMRNETVVRSPAGGRIQLMVKHGERVRVGTPLFIVITDPVQKENYEKELLELAEKIEEIQQDSGSHMSINIIEKSIDDVTKKLQEAVSEGQYEKIKSLKNELEKLNSERQKAFDAKETNLEVLQQSYETLQDKMKDIELLAKAPTAGLVSFTIDGFEQSINQDDISIVSYSQIEQLVVKSYEMDFSKPLKANDPVLKIIDNYSWSIVAKIERNMEKGMLYEIKFNATGDKINAKLVEIIEADGGRLGIFSFEREFPGFLDLRKTTVEITSKIHTGKIIPLDSIVTEDGVEGVYLLHKKRKIFKPVKIVAKDERNAIVDGLNIGNRILTTIKGDI
jgi:putative membrane fusion protein